VLILSGLVGFLAIFVLFLRRTIAGKQLVNQSVQVVKTVLLRNRAEGARAGGSPSVDKILAYLHPKTSLPGLASIAINRPRFTIGREIAAGCNYAIPQNYISSQHLSIKQVNDKFVILDLNSSNGTRVNGVRLQPHKEYILASGDTITLSDGIVFLFEVNSSDVVPVMFDELPNVTGFSTEDARSSLPVFDQEQDRDYNAGTNTMLAIDSKRAQRRQASGLRPSPSSSQGAQSSKDANLPTLKRESKEDDRVSPNFDELDIDWNA